MKAPGLIRLKPEQVGHFRDAPLLCVDLLLTAVCMMSEATSACMLPLHNIHVSTHVHSWRWTRMDKLIMSFCVFQWAHHPRRLLISSRRHGDPRADRAEEEENRGGHGWVSVACSHFHSSAAVLICHLLPQTRSCWFFCSARWKQAEHLTFQLQFNGFIEGA